MVLSPRWLRRRPQEPVGWGLVQMQTQWDTCRPMSLRRINSRTPKVTQDSPQQGRKESSPKLEKAGLVRTLEPGTLKKLVNHLVPAQLCRDPFFVPAFLAIYRRFATPLQVLDQLFLRYRFFHPDSEEDQQNKRALSSILETWLLQYPGDFALYPGLASLRQLVAYALINLPDSDIILQVCRLPTRLGAH
ncbi:ral guanine nucleotide dissociation stimulator-like isoform X1 [Cavia porcellus]|uniref:ral guanine nucleotide dissociation stimulator-like isoform X1 n=1 Tax=Cavia porcellus TaxID=10141 RepID=UPI000661944E|nr:ral guanine nucleotide dissociation stimulator-like isoform X1 [Cavia porcellus]XP_013001489.1 ral guanine nucleotide dissociation stimulator-like isoform X1 [Cavia porcellus]XP_013001490.1 ral guanine nucleotide dissociation stimulator-like isoform X1 [Cavia porcellus]